jgi:hypothetical protein
MIENKAKLLDDNKKFIKSADKKIWNTLLKEMTKLVMPLLFLVSFLGFYFLYKNLSFETFKDVVSLVPLVGLISFLLIYVVYSQLKGVNRFSAVERLAWPFFVSYQMSTIVLNLSQHVKEDTSTFWLIVGLSLALTFMLLLIRVSIALFKTNTNRFKHLV